MRGGLPQRGCVTVQCSRNGVEPAAALPHVPVSKHSRIWLVLPSLIVASLTCGPTTKFAVALTRVTLPGPCTCGRAGAAIEAHNRRCAGAGKQAGMMHARATMGGAHAHANARAHTQRRLAPAQMRTNA
jgi:hypothetical protein